MANTKSASESLDAGIRFVLFLGGWSSLFVASRFEKSGVVACDAVNANDTAEVVAVAVDWLCSCICIGGRPRRERKT